MFACPSISWIARKSAPPPNRCVANEFRNECGFTTFVMPAALVYFFTNTQIVFREIAVPRLLKKNALPVFCFTKCGRPTAR